MADTQNTNVQEQDIHQLLKVKREKLANLQQAGKDPFHAHFSFPGSVRLISS